MTTKQPLLKATIIASIAILNINCAGTHSVVTTPAYTPGLGEIMSLTSMRHAKLWFAAQSNNWALAEYELEELKEGFEDVAHFHPTHKEIKQPLPSLIAKTMDPALAGLDIAIKNRNKTAFNEQFDNMTAGCNACHQATDFGFNVVIRPVSNPFANQQF